MKFAMRQFGLVALAAGFLTLGLSSDASAQRKLSFAYDQPVTTAYGIAANLFDEKLKALSGGKLSINQFPGAQLGTEPQTLQKLRAGDRKSTRLNSSHSQISYAVFCLKKKTH